MIRIKNKTGLSHHTELYNENGSRIHGVASVDISIQPNDVVTAKINFAQTDLDIEAEPLLSLDSLKHFAKHYGYALVEVNNE